jgi:hypothetical protein
MKSVKNLVYAVLLAFILGVSANAEGGDQGTPGIVASPTPPPNHVIVSTDDPKTAAYYGDPSAGSTQTSDYLFYEALVALLSVY